LPVELSEGRFTISAQVIDFILPAMILAGIFGQLDELILQKKYSHRKNQILNL